jgi:hypothetical protein
MSGVLTQFTGFAGNAADLLAQTGVMPAWFRKQRKIDMIIPDVTIEESHSDRVTVTQHPIAKGSPVSDHAYKMPATVTMRLGFSNTKVMGGVVSGFLGGGGFGDIGGGLAGAGGAMLSSFMEERAKEVYDRLIKLQFDRDAWDAGKVALEPFELVTGKRTYPNMVITEISVRTDHTSEYALMVEVHMQEVFIVETSSTTQPALADQSAPEKTGTPADKPDQTAKPTPKPDPDSELLQIKKHGIGYLFNRGTA